MRVGILGTGNVGQALGRGFANSGHQVMMGSRDPAQEKVRAWVETTGGTASAGKLAEAAAFAELAVLATVWEGTANAIKLAGPENLAGKIVIDPTNPLDFSGGMPPKLAVGHTNSGGEEVQRLLPDAYVVKAFNSVNFQHMINPQFPGGPPDMFICGNNPQAKKSVAAIIQEFGWSVIDSGGIEASRYLEPLAMVYILHFFGTGGNYAFKLLTK